MTVSIAIKRMNNLFVKEFLWGACSRVMKRGCRKLGPLSQKGLDAGSVMM